MLKHYKSYGEKCIYILNVISIVLDTTTLVLAFLLEVVVSIFSILYMLINNSILIKTDLMTAYLLNLIWRNELLACPTR